ncbi:MAG: hypothetical protein ACI835_001941 [Planctomycetota bacterium]|jgi:hypothetical protein
MRYCPRIRALAWGRDPRDGHGPWRHGQPNLLKLAESLCRGNQQHGRRA